jgi:hypothetical protein
MGDNNITYKRVQKNTYPYTKKTFKGKCKKLKNEIDSTNNNYVSIDEFAAYLGMSNNFGEVGHLKVNVALKNQHSIEAINFHAYMLLIKIK